MKDYLITRGPLTASLGMTSTRLILEYFPSIEFRRHSLYSNFLK